MRRLFFILASAIFTILCWPALSQTQLRSAPQPGTPSSSYYVSNGEALELVSGDPSLASYSQWQAWLYPHHIQVSRSGTGLASVRWGLIQGASAKEVMEQLASYQRFEEAYADLFGDDTWGSSTFSYAVGPIAIAKQLDAANPYASRVDVLNRALQTLVADLYPSLRNAGRDDRSRSLRPYFDEIRNSMQYIARLSSKVMRLPDQQNYLAEELAAITPRVMQAKSVVPKVIAILPNVKLPVGKDWMAQTENAGKDGSVTKTVTELGASAWVEQSWTGGDGAMDGARVITIVPYQNIGSLSVSFAPFGNQLRWALDIQSAKEAFPETITGPERITNTAVYPAVDLNDKVNSIFLEFPNPSEAQDAYSFFLYHKERGM